MPEFLYGIASRLTNPKLGIIKRVNGDGGQTEPLIEIELTDKSCVSLVLRWTPADFSIVGSLVIVSEEDGLLLHQQYAEIPFHSFKRMPRLVGGGWYTCTRCNASVQHGTGHEQACRARLERLNWTEGELVELEGNLVTKAWQEIPGGDPLKVQKIAKALVLERIQKLPRFLRNLLLHRFEEEKWTQVSYFR